MAYQYPAATDYAMPAGTTYVQYPAGTDYAMPAGTTYMMDPGAAPYTYPSYSPYMPGVSGLDHSQGKWFAPGEALPPGYVVSAHPEGHTAPQESHAMSDLARESFVIPASSAAAAVKTGSAALKSKSKKSKKKKSSSCC